MIDRDYCVLMARYNQWQNGSLYTAANTLVAEERTKDRGAFFKSIHSTLSHLIWGDGMWMSRFAGFEKPVGTIAASGAYVADWAELERRRIMLDAQILAWAQTLDDAQLAGDLSWSSASLGGEMTQPRWQAVTHMFNHQTHHRGQVHAMLTAAGARPEATDLIILSREAP